MDRYLRIIILLAVLVAPLKARASALAFPPTQVRMVIFNAIDGTTLNATATTVQLNTLATGINTTRSVLVGNDAAVDATGNSDLLIDFSGATATTPTNGVAGSTTIRIFPGKEYNFDGQFTSCSIKSRATAIPIHLFVTY